MARDFTNYSPVVPGGTTWEEEIEVVDLDGARVDLTNYIGKGHLRADIADAAPAFALTTAHITILPQGVPATKGLFRIKVAYTDVTTLLGGGTEKKKYGWDVELRNETVSPYYVIPIVTGKVTIKPRYTR